MDRSCRSISAHPGGVFARLSIQRHKRSSSSIRVQNQPPEMPYKWSPATSPCEQRFYSIIGATVSVDKSPSRIDDVSVQRISMVLPDGVTTEILIAPSLGCRVLQSTTSRKGRV